MYVLLLRGKDGVKVLDAYFESATKVAIRSTNKMKRNKLIGALFSIVGLSYGTNKYLELNKTTKLTQIHDLGNSDRLSDCCKSKAFEC